MASSVAALRRRLDPASIRRFVDDLVGDDLHAKRVLSLSNAVAGVLAAASLAIHAIGAGYAALSGGDPRHGTKQVDRLLSNAALAWDVVLTAWVRFAVGDRPELVVALDWTSFDADGHTTLCAYLVTDHGRATPLLWQTVHRDQLRDRRNAYEYDLCERLHRALPDAKRITLLGDRGFGDQKLYRFLEALGWDYVIRFRASITVTQADGRTAKARDLVGPTGRARKLLTPRVTAQKVEVPAVVLVHEKGMKEAWCLATTLTDKTAKQVIRLYGKRFSIEETFRDQKDHHFGLGLRATHIRSCERRDRLLLLAALAQGLLTLLGAAGEQCGLDKGFRSSPKRGRAWSLFRQGLFWYQALPNLPERKLRPLMTAFDRLLRDQPLFRELFGVL